MIYIYISLIALLVIVVSSYSIRSSRMKEDENLLEEIPNVYINKENLEKHAAHISTYYSTVSKGNSKRRIIKNLDNNYKAIIDSYEHIDKASKDNREILGAAEWMLDNLYLIEKEYKTIKYNMPSSYYKNLPVIDKGIMKGYPRVYQIAVELVTHRDGIMDEETIESFIKAYEKNAPLTMGELWALPLMLRMALIQNISNISKKIKYAQKEKFKAEIIGDKLIKAYSEKRLGEELTIMEAEKIDFTTEFTERLVKILRDNALDSDRVYQWINKGIDSTHMDLDHIIVNEHVMESNFQISMGNSITSLRAIEALDWNKSFEKLSYVEQILRKDPYNVYKDMDFESRDYYRHKVEELSRGLNVEEITIAKKALECALSEANSNKEPYKAHIGYYIVDEGLKTLKKAIDTKDSFRINSYIRKYPLTFYLGSIALGILFLESLLISLQIINGAQVNIWYYVLAIIALLIPASEIVISILNWSINRLLSPRFVPKLEFKDGIPEKFSTMVVIPTLLNNEKRVKELMEDLEIYYLANKEENLYFSILGDFKDSSKEREEKDEDIIACALSEVKRLNKKYAEEGRDIFYFFNRHRKFNEKQGIWLGWERKRGKLMEFNSLLRGDKNTSYNIISGNMDSLSKIKYIITLDADTELPRDGAKKLIGAIAHILNKAYILKSGEHKRVFRGYGLIQPRVTVGTLAANRTLFSKIFSGETGIDLYTMAISDTYQDLFGEGIFTGKGVYDVDIFNYMLKGEIPENSVLSHDLLEGSYVRCALATDIELVDGYPAYYNASSLRLHRWVRGDWQLLPWLFKKSPLNTLSKWKIIDNLRRSLLAPSIIILILLSLSVLPGNLGLWITIAYLSIVTPILFDVSENVVSPMRGIALTGRISNFKIAAEQLFLIFSFIPYQSYMMLDAIIRTLYRLFISKRNLLEWQTAADVEASSGKKLSNYIRAMWWGSAIAVLILFLAFNIEPSLALTLLPSCIIWFLSPFTAYYISKDISYKKVELPYKDALLLKELSRRTWAYFEDFVNEENNWLAPDNFQEDPPNGLATRTSPTNVGMGLISNIVAYDLGYIGIEENIERLENIVENVEGLTKYKGHLYNWYDTISKEPLFPRYVSTVDSGNLVGYLWVVSEALKEYMNSPILRDIYIEGMLDTIHLAKDELEEVNYYDEEIKSILENKNMNLTQYKRLLMDLRSKAIDIERLNPKANIYWNLKIKSMVNNRIKELQNIFPWTDSINLKEGYEELYSSLKTLAREVPLNHLTKEIEELISKHSSGLEHNIELLNLMENSIKYIDKLLSRTKELIEALNTLSDNTDFTVLYDEKRGLFSIGYDIEKDTLGNNYYDLLASEARAASYIAIARGEVEQKHWFKLGRAMTYMNGSKGLVSWSGTMFEYFMPLLIMKSYPDTLLNTTYYSVLEGQKNYAKERRTPWGISESAFYYFDINLNYQYKAFGVPGIGLKRGLSDELVVAPYATVMTLQMNNKDAIRNIKEFVKDGVLGRYGLYEAIDYTKDRIPKGVNRALVKCFMVHHQGMSLMALNNFLNNNVLQERFHRVPEVKASELLLQEKVPKNVVYDREQRFTLGQHKADKQPIIVRSYTGVSTEIPEVQLLSNGSYSLMLSNSGSGYSKKDNMTIYRWREDVTEDSNGMFFYIKNINSNEYWSATYEPCKNEGESYEAIFALDKITFKRKDGNLLTEMEVAVSNEDDTEVRRISLTNQSDHTRVIEVTSYMEVTLAPYNADIVHPTFSNLFISTEYVEEKNCIIASRRPRAKGQSKPHIMQVVTIEGEAVGPLQYETSRINFIGRNRNKSNPLVMDNDAPLQNTVGAVLDPIVSLRKRVKIKPGETCRLSFATALSDSREKVIELAQKYKEIQNVNRVFEGALNHTQVELNYLGIRSTQANLYQFMASRIIFLNTFVKDRDKYIQNIERYQKHLWPYGISGDLPIVLLVVQEEKDIDLVRQVIGGHEYLSLKGLKFDLVILNEQNANYTQPLQDSIRDLIFSSGARDKQNKPGGIFVHNKAGLGEDIKNLLFAIARLVIDSKKGSLVEQIKKEEEEKVNLEKKEEELIEEENKNKVVSYVRNINHAEQYAHAREATIALKTKTIWNREMEGNIPLKWKKQSFALELGSEIMNSYNSSDSKRSSKAQFYDISQLQYFNGLGGFDINSNNYVIVLNNFKNTPAPWINVISNGDFGFHVSETGSAYTWCKNSRENKITPWNNDPIIDEMGEALFLRDEEDGEFWSISPKPIRDSGQYVIEHGFGYSNFSHENKDIQGMMTMFVPMTENVKLIRVKLKNNSLRKRKLSITYFARLALGVVPEQSSQYISTYIETAEKFIYSKNPYSEHFGNLKAYLKISGGEEASFTGNRKEFIGRGGILSYALAMRKEKLSNACGAGFDPCMAQCSKITLEAEEEKTLIIALGQHEDLDHIKMILIQYEDISFVEKKLEESKGYWRNLLGTIQVKTPDKSMDLMLNGWLMYQTLSCRYWARTAFYQSGGAYGFRDQLQDSMAIGFINPEFTKNQILRSASRQYVEGDVQHWWHPVVNSGIRTRFSDDLLWLPYTTIDYIKNTGDYSILDEVVSYLEDEPLKEGEDERYNVVGQSNKEGSIYEHCVKTLDRALKFGEHNIPLMGSGDWNDGMSTVGNEGKGESVWLGWFLYDILDSFIELCSYKSDIEKEKKYKEMKEYIKDNLEKNAWDGGWYRRAYFDDGTPLGSIENDECQIDSLSQSWAIISEAGKDSRVKEAMESIEKYLIREDKGMILLLYPAFNNSKLEPGYIKGYVPGVRENGGQYTHAAIWVILAMAKLGKNNRAWELFNMINPINHTLSTLECERYKVEPYVMCADVYAREPHGGRGGWSWYTGASGWMYRVGIEAILGLKLQGCKGFSIEPCIPDHWNEYEIVYRKGEAVYNIKVTRGEEKSIKINGEELKENIIPFYQKGQYDVNIVI